MGTALDDLIALLDLEPLEVNLFRGVSPKEDRQRVFGGQVAGQALVAAGRTVEPDRPVNSLHAYFLRPGDPTVPIVYEVDRIRDGKSFTTRRVVAIQHGRAIFNLAASFHIEEGGPDHQDPMPDVQMPDELPTFQEQMAEHRERFSPDMADWLERERPIDQRPTELPSWMDPGPRSAPPGRLDQGQRPASRRSAAPRVRRRLRVRPDHPRHGDASARRSRIARTSSRSPASTTRCGSTARSGPTPGCCTTSGANPRVARVASRKVPSSPSTAGSRSP